MLFICRHWNQYPSWWRVGVWWGRSQSEWLTAGRIREKRTREKGKKEKEEEKVRFQQQNFTKYKSSLVSVNVHVYYLFERAGTK